MFMNSTLSDPSIATSEAYWYLEEQVQEKEFGAKNNAEGLRQDLQFFKKLECPQGQSSNQTDNPTTATDNSNKTDHYFQALPPQAPEPVTFSLVKRKARYHDKSRIRLKDIKAEALRNCGCNSSAEIKQCLKALNVKLDLRYTCSWITLARQLCDAIASVRLTLKISDRKPKKPLLPEIKVGDRVRWDYQEPMLCYLEQWFPLEVLSIANGEAQLELLSRLVPVS